MENEEIIYKRLKLDVTFVKSMRFNGNNDVNQKIIDYVIELLSIGRQPWKEDRPYPSVLSEEGALFFEQPSYLNETTGNKKRTIEIGKYLYSVGGQNLLLEVCAIVKKKLPSEVRELDYAWHGIGDWMA